MFFIKNTVDQAIAPLLKVLTDLENISDERSRAFRIRNALSDVINPEPKE